MKHLIDKSALVAEIERRKQDAINNCGGFKSGREHECDSCIVAQYEEMEDIINTLEVKGVDLEKEIKRFTMSKELYEANSVIKAVAEHFFELGLNKARNIWHDASEKLPTGVIVVNNGGNLHIGWSTDEGDGIEDEHGRLITKTYQKWAREKDLT